MASVNIVKLSKRGEPYKARLRYRDETGRRKSTVVYHDPLEVAAVEKSLRERLEKAQAIRGAHGQALPIERLLSDWIIKRTAKGAMSEAYGAEARREIGRMLAEMPAWKFPADVTKGSLEQWEAKREGTNIHRPKAYLRALLRWSMRVHQQSPSCLQIDWEIPRARRSRQMLTGEQIQEIYRRAIQLGQYPLVHCLALYGWRPSTACRLTVGDVRLLADGISTVLLGRLKNGDDLVHALDAETVMLLAPLVQGRAPTEPLFLSPLHRAWYVYQGSKAQELSKWAAKYLLRGMDGVELYDLKRYALTRMLADTGNDVAAVQRVTGHRSKDQVLVYAQTNLERQAKMLARLTAPAPTTPAG